MSSSLSLLLANREQAWSLPAMKRAARPLSILLVLLGVSLLNGKIIMLFRILALCDFCEAALVEFCHSFIWNGRKFTLIDCLCYLCEHWLWRRIADCHNIPAFGTWWGFRQRLRPILKESEC